MRILFISNAIFGESPGLSGGETRFIEIAKSWARNGHEIHLMSSKWGKILCDNLGLEVVFHNISNARKVGRITFILRALKALFFLPKSLRNFKEGVVYSANEMIFDVIPALRMKLNNRKGIRWTTVVHWLPPAPWIRKKSTFFDATLFFISERISIWLSNWFADALLPVSLMTAKQLSNAGINMKKVHPVECGVNYVEIRNIACGVKEKKHDAVFMKRLQAVKGIFDLIEIWEMVVSAKPDAKLLVIGEGPDHQKTQRIVKEKGLDNNVEFTGAIYDFEEKIKKIAESRLFLLPSYEENWAIVIGEAMAAGVPVISYGLKELVDVWKNNFIQIPVGDKVVFAKNIINLIDAPATLKDISQRSIQYVKRYDWRAIAEKELRIIRGGA